MMNQFFKFGHILLVVSIVHCDQPTIRQTTNGPVEGLKETSILGKKYYSFRGIPYAEVPITGIDPYTGAKVDRRFKPPKPLSRNWTDNLVVQNFGDGCVASTSFMPSPARTSENCLFLNIYVPAGGAKEKTVLVWIPGGGFTEGSGDDFFFGPDFLIHSDNVLVTLNYRVGIFGFLNLGFDEYTGNMGLKDQQLALKWINQNIKNFSGKNDQILLFGQSAGSTSVNYHMLNEESKKYFNRAILLSGTALNDYALYEPNHLKRLQKISKICDEHKLVEYLKVTDSATLAKIQTTNDYGKILLKTPWAPTIESPTAAGAFITMHPEEIYKSGEAPVIDTIFGFTSQEYITFNHDLTKDAEPILNGDWKDSRFLMPFVGFEKDKYPEEYKKAFQLLKKVYMNTTNFASIKHGNIALLSDSNFGYGILKTVKHQVAANNKGRNRNTKKNTFVQRFAVNNDINIVKTLFQLNYDGASHGEDFCFLFRCHALDPLKVYENALKVKNSSNVNYNVIMRLVTIVTNFARTGNPSVDGDTVFQSSISPDKVLAQDITNDQKTKLVSNIMKQLHFNTWNEIENSFRRARAARAGRKSYKGFCNSSSHDEHNNQRI